MRLVLIVAAVILLTVTALAADKPDFSGTWRLDASGNSDSQSGEKLIIEQHGQEVTIRSGASATENNKTDVVCNTMGKECQATLAGDSVTVTYWYNGPALIEMAIVGKSHDRVTETRRRLSEDGRKMLVEVLPIVPSGKSPDKLVFVREQKLAAGSSVAP